MAGPIDLAQQQVGLRSDGASVTDLKEYLRNGGANLDPQKAAWCAAFVNATLQQSGYNGTGSNLARSFLDIGTPVDKPERGDIAVFSRGNRNSIYGHVGFFDHINPETGNPVITGGNQSKSVSTAEYDGGRLLGYRRLGAPSPDANQQISNAFSSMTARTMARGGMPLDASQMGMGGMSHDAALAMLSQGQQDRQPAAEPDFSFFGF